MSFIARFQGRCHADCGTLIVPGERVEYVGDELMHEDCADGGPSDAALERARREAHDRRTPCPSCFMIHAGECM